MFEKNVKWKLYSFENILEAAPNKTATVEPLTSHLTNHSIKTRKHAGHYWRSKRRFLMGTHRLTSVDRPEKTSIH